MPYTPPLLRSPASSTSVSPDVSRRSSFQSGARPALPRSASYLSKHRRTPSITSVDGHVGPLAVDGPGDGPGGEALRDAAAPALGGSVRQSPPPPLDRRELMPKGAIFSPPESTSSGSDEDEPPEVRARGRDALKDLRDAVSQMPLPRTPSPDQGLLHVSLSTGSLGELAAGGRKAGHVRSATEPGVAASKSARASPTLSDGDDSDAELKAKPQMVRKKSGELVRPALRASRRRPSSMPGTPVFSKAVHFDSHLEHVRHFLQVDRPLAVSAGSSPVETYDSDGEFPWAGDVEWELVVDKPAHDAQARRAMAARLERVWLSGDQRSMLGSVAVANLAFHKHVSCRFTLDYWKTVSEVAAEYSHEIRPRETPLGHDRFTFAIKLCDTANLEDKTLFFCIRYAVGGHEYWDNNNAANFRVGFRKRRVPHGARAGQRGGASRPLDGLPRSTRRPGGGLARPVSMAPALDGFGGEPRRFGLGRQPMDEYLGESGPLRLRAKSSANLAGDNWARGLAPPSGVAFSNRYDFGASLSAAMQAARDAPAKDKDALYMKRNVRGMEPADDSPSSGSPDGSASPGPGLPSASYEELVNKYCFFGSKQAPCAVEDGAPRAGASFDGSDDGRAAGSSAGRRQNDGPRVRHGHDTATHHSLRLADAPRPFSPYVATGSLAAAASPASAKGNGRKHQLSKPLAAGVPRSAPSPLASGACTPSSDVSYHGQQPVLADRFPWTSETQASTAIRG